MFWGLTVDWYLHWQAIGRLGPLLLIVPLPWLIAVYFYLDPLAAFGVVPVSKASWGEFPHTGYLRAACAFGISMTGGVLGPYLVVYWQASRGERVSPAPWTMYMLTIGGLVAGASIYVVLKYFPTV